MDVLSSCSSNHTPLVQLQKRPSGRLGFFDLPAEIRNHIITYALSAYSGHISLLRDSGRLPERLWQGPLGPIALLLVSQRLTTEIRKQIVWHYLVQLPRHPFFRGHLLHNVRSATIQLDRTSSVGRTLRTLGQLQSLEDLQIRMLRPRFHLLEKSLTSPVHFKTLRTLHVIDLALLGSSDLPPFNKRIDISEELVDSMSVGGAINVRRYEKLVEEAERREDMGEWIQGCVKQKRPERDLGVYVWPTADQVREAIVVATMKITEQRMRDSSLAWVGISTVERASDTARLSRH